MSPDDEYCIWHQANEEYQQLVREKEEREEQEAREAAAIEHIVDLIRSRVAPAGDNPIKNEKAPVIAGGEVIAYGNTYTTAFLVQITVNYLEALFAHNKDKSPWGIVRENEKALNEVVEKIQALQRSLDKLPNGLPYLLYSKEMPGQMSLKFRTTMAREHSEALARFPHFIVTLKAMEDRCGELLSQPPGERPDTNYRNRMIAFCAADLLDYHGIRPTRGNDAKASLFEQIASSLSEAVTGEQGVGLTYACRRVLEDWKTQHYLRNDFNQSEGKS
jgi:hypothetical protein